MPISQLKKPHDFLMKLSIAHSIVLILFLTGCSVGSRYTVPQTPLPAHWSQKNDNTLATQDDDKWWQNFHDPILNELIEQQSVYNINLKIAEARVIAARAELAQVTAQFFPIASFEALPPNGTGVNITQVIGLITSLEIDLFGKLRQTRESRKARLEAEIANRNFTLLNLYAEIASSYLELREAQTKYKILKANLSGNQTLFTFLKSRYKSGFINYINVAQQDALIDTQQAEIEQNKSLIIALLHKIELLSGKPPGRLAKKLLPPKPVPEMTRKINLDVPASLLCRRPDIVAAERNVAATHANIRAAIASLFPKVAIGWLLAWQTETLQTALFTLQNPDSTLWGIFKAPILNLEIYRNIGLQKRLKIIAVLQYQLAIMNALHDVENQYNYAQHAQLSAQHLNHAVSQKRLVLKLSKDAYQKGSSDFNTVLRSEEDLNNLEITHLHNVVLYQIARINLYKALGGGIRDPQTK